MSLSLKLLRKVRCRLLDRTSGRPIPGVVVSLFLQPDEGSALRFPVATLASDATGYLSFDLAPLIKLGLDIVPGLLVSAPEVGLKDQPLLEGSASSNSGGTEQHFELVIEQSASAEARNSICIEFPIFANERTISDSAAEASCGAAKLPAVQSPDACDYALSPYSFVTPAKINLGGDCCEALVPSTLPVQEHGFYRVIVRPDKEVSEAVPRPMAKAVDLAGAVPAARLEMRLAKVLEYRQRWYALGHSLGEIKYSLPLAPGESTQLAVIEWSRDDSASRFDKVRGTEFLTHELKRDRTIEESVDAFLKEDQGGWSLMGGLSVGGALSGEKGKLAGNAALGFGVSHSWGERNLEANSQQELEDKVRQGTAYVRSLSSTVIVQASQAEQNFVQTRRVANHNHCHALTIQYYEVLRHFRLETTFVRTRKAILIPFASLSFNWELASRYRTILESVLLDPSVAPGFEAIVRLHLATSAYTIDAPPPPPPPPPQQTGAYWSGSEIGITVKANEDPHDTFKMIEKDSTVSVTAAGSGLKFSVDRGAGYGPQGSDEIADHTFPLAGAQKYELLAQIGGDWYRVGSGKTFTAKNSGPLSFRFNDYKFDDNSGQALVTLTVSRPSAPPPPPPDPEKEQLAKPAYDKPTDELAEVRLIAHLCNNVGYYSRAVWSMLDPTERRLYLESALANDRNILNVLDDTPIAVSGSHVAFPYFGPFPDWPEDDESGVSTPPIESIVTLPTRGLFAEAQLGHCNSCEQRDVTRMWDWREMTTEEPPVISGIAPGPKGEMPNLTTLQLPDNVIQITQPPAAPDPTGLAAALSVLKTPDIFRDMSGLDEVSQLLGKLADGTTASLEGMIAGATEAKKKLDAVRDGKAGSNGASGSQGSPRQGRTQPNESDAGAQVDRLQAIEEARRRGLISDQEARNASLGVLGGEVIPTGIESKYFMPTGIDVSHHQGKIDWDKVKAANIVFAFIKASDGNAFKDPRFKTNLRGARKAGLPCGAYHFWRPQYSGKDQAELLIEQLGERLREGDLPPALDLEEGDDGRSNYTGLKVADLESNIQEFLDTVEAKYGVTPIIYTSNEFWTKKDRLNNSKNFSRYPLWVVDWDINRPRKLPGGWWRWEFRQFTETGRVDGVVGKVDMNWYGDDISALWELTYAGVPFTEV